MSSEISHAYIYTRPRWYQSFGGSFCFVLKGNIIHISLDYLVNYQIIYIGVVRFMVSRLGYLKAIFKRQKQKQLIRILKLQQKRCLNLFLNKLRIESSVCSKIYHRTATSTLAVLYNATRYRHETWYIALTLNVQISINVWTDSDNGSLSVCTSPYPSSQYLDLEYH